MDDWQQDTQEAQEAAEQSQHVVDEAPVAGIFTPPSVDSAKTLRGESYSHYSDIPEVIAHDKNIECVLGVDEAGRGPVLGPMVYALFYLPLDQHTTLLADTHHFDDSKVLTPAVRSDLMRKLCSAGSDLQRTCGWATRALSARDISAQMLGGRTGTHNLNAQAMDATVALVQGVIDRGVSVAEIYVDTIGSPAAYQARLARLFPTARVTVAKKADSLYPCVSAASVCAKVTRDAALEACWRAQGAAVDAAGGEVSMAEGGWGSGYPSDARCAAWLRREMDPLFGWGPECRFSWGTAKELLEVKNRAPKVEWPDDDDADGAAKMTDFFAFGVDDDGGDGDGERNEMMDWYGRRVEEGVF